MKKIEVRAICNVALSNVNEEHELYQTCFVIWDNTLNKSLKMKTIDLCFLKRD